MFKAFLAVLFATSFHNFHFEEAGFEKGKRDFKIRALTKIDFAESSGMEADEDGFWTHGDSGGKPVLVKYSADGDLIDSLHFPQITNIDWEDIARDDEGNWYVGEIGNNLNKRKDLKIYKIGEEGIETIHFNWEDQFEFPPSEQDLNFDCEAFFWHDNNLYLFSKNRGEGPVRVYILPDEPGDHIAKVIDEIELPRMVTSADVNEAGTEFSLLGYGVIYTFDFSNKLKPFEQPKRAHRFSRGGQSEGLAYTSESELIISNEGGKIFRLLKRRNN